MQITKVAELKRLTKRQLQEWLTKHDQRIPVEERTKPYYLERAQKYFALLQKENDGVQQNQQNRPVASSRSKSKSKTVVSKSKLRGRGVPSTKSKTKRKSNTSSSSSSASGKSRPGARTQRRHSNIGLSPSKASRSSSPATALQRSRKRVIKVPHKSPGRRDQSPSLAKALQKKRERVRRVTADPTNLEKAANQSALLVDQLPTSSDDDSDEVADEALERERSNNLMKRKFVLAQDPEKMTIGRMQDWLDDNNIAFELGKLKKYYIEHVRQHALPRQHQNEHSASSTPSLQHNKRVLSPNHKKAHSPSNKKPKANISEMPTFDSPARVAVKASGRAPMPPHIQQSPMTPKDEREEKRQSRSISSGARLSGYQMKKGLLTTPTLNKTGIRKIDTPSKLAMRDEIRNFLLCGDDSPMRPMTNDTAHDGEVLTGDMDTPMGPTPGGPDGEQLDYTVLNDVLSDLRKVDPAQPVRPLQGRADTFDVDSISFPQRQSVSPGTMAKEAMSMLTTTQMTGKKKSRSRSMVANRTRPSPAMSDERDEVAMAEQARSAQKMDRHNGNFPPPSQRKVDSQPTWNSVPATPSMADFDYANIRPGQSKAHYDGTASVPTTVKRTGRRRQSFPQRTPATRNHLIEDEPMSPAIHAHSVEQQSRMTGARMGRSNVLQHNHNVNVPNTVHESPGVVAPPTPSKAQSGEQSSMDTKVNEQKAQGSRGGGICRTLCTLLMLGMVGGVVGVFFTMFDGMNRLNEWSDIAMNYQFGVEERVPFCDTNSLSIQMGDGSVNEQCVACPDHSSLCAHGKVRCLTNYVERANRCVMDSSKIKFAYTMHSQISAILSERRGQFECGEMQSNEDFAMRRDELLSHCVLSDESKKEEAFAYFEENILSEASTLSVDDKGRYYSTKGKKSKVCLVTEWCLSNVLGLMATSVVLCVTFAIWRKQKRKQWEAAEVERLLLGVYEVLEEYQRFTEHSHVPIDVVRQRVQPRSDELWQRVDAMIDGDKKIKRSLRMMDGMHKKCVQLTAMAQSGVGAGAANHHFGGNLVGSQGNSKQW